jgi:DNA invertase Pin-like site-specific DNA recombinase
MLDYQLNNPVVLEKVSRWHRGRTMEVAQRDRVLEEAGVRRLTLMDQFLMHIGGMLITLGLKLQERCLLAMPQGTRPHPTKY